MDLTRLPDDKFPTILNGLDQITSRTVYQQLCQRREDLAGMSRLQQIFESTNFWVTKDKTLSFHDIHYSIIPKLLINIPMRQHWMDELDGINDLDQLKLFFVAGCCGHFELFQHIYNTNNFLNENNSNIISTATSKEISWSQLFRYMLVFAAERGYNRVIQFIWTKVTIVDNTDAISDSDDDDDEEPETINPTNATTRPTLYKSMTRHAMDPAIKGGQLETVQLLITLGVEDPIGFQNRNIETAAAAGHLEIVKYLLTFPGVDPTSRFNAPFTDAASQGHLEVVKFLLTLPGVDPTALNNFAIRKAAAKGHLEVVKFLLTDPRVDATARNNEAVTMAALAGHAEVVAVLLTYPGVHLRSFHQILFDNSQFNQYLAAVPHKERIPDRRLDATKIWLRYGNVTAAVISEQVLCKAVDVCELDVVKLLVEFPGVDVTFDDYRAVREAAFQGNKEVLECFMKVPGIDTIAMASKAISHGRRDVVQWLKSRGFDE
ncbi:hypothetical protein HDU76_000700 [Blyttiomyces sp. JEL0837]|nr:hypothetical protein HDU76_000700 [Blyttiomyces sp. JEL0837]